MTRAGWLSFVGRMFGWPSPLLLIDFETRQIGDLQSVRTMSGAQKPQILTRSILGRKIQEIQNYEEYEIAPSYLHSGVMYGIHSRPYYSPLCIIFNTLVSSLCNIFHFPHIGPITPIIILPTNILSHNLYSSRPQSNSLSITACLYWLDNTSSLSTQSSSLGPSHRSKEFRSLILLWLRFWRGLLGGGGGGSLFGGNAGVGVRQVWSIRLIELYSSLFCSITICRGRWTFCARRSLRTLQFF